MKSGSGFKGQLYFHVGQMEGPKVRSLKGPRRTIASTRGWALKRDAVVCSSSSLGNKQYRELFNYTHDIHLQQYSKQRGHNSQ